MFGNPHVKKDSLPLRILPSLRKKFPRITFREFDAAEDLEKEGRELYIIDAVEGIPKPCILTDQRQISTQKIFSMHDFDLAIMLKLLKKMGFIDRFIVFGVPPAYSEKHALSEMSRLINSILLSKSAKRNSCRGRRRG